MSDPPAPVAIPMRVNRCGTEQHRLGSNAKRLGQPVPQRLAAHLQLTPHAERLLVPCAERTADLEAERARQDGGVSELRMTVERQVRPIERDVVLEQTGDTHELRSNQRADPSPEQPMMDDQQVGFPLRRHSDGRGTEVDGGGNAADFPGVRDLEAVPRVGRVPDVADIE